jgi:hypothetical protein
MTKGQGYTTIGAVLLAGVMFRGSLSSGPSQGSDKPRETPPASAEKPMTGEGPWLASCRYWAAVLLTPSAAATTTPQLNIKLTQTDTTFDAAVTGSVDGTKTPCEQSGDVWGIPNKATPGLEIHAIIATVSDPIHSHLALEFDRSIDSLMQAAADNHYLGSAYWLPWRSPSTPATLVQPTAADQTMERKRQEQPGLIILKYSPVAGEPNAETTSFYHVVYLFLVGESPALGMDGTPLHNALEYEKHLREVYGAALSMESPGDAANIPYTLAFIGPRSSGSATSLRQALLSASATFAKPPDKMIGAGGSSTQISQSELNAISSPPITYISFGEDTKFEENRLVEAFVASRNDAEHTAVLAEDSTVFGAANLLKDINPTTSPKGSPPLYIRFPREISLLRNAQVEQGLSSPPSQAPSPYLNLSLKDPGANDTIPKFSTTQTPLSQEAQLMAIERQLQKKHIRHILISASNMLDEIFLARELHRACPNATIVFYNGADLLVERDVDNVPYIGAITVTPYSLVTFDRPSVDSRRFFSDSQAAAVYNAASYIFWWGSVEWKNDHLPRLAGSFNPSTNSLQFPLMAMAVGADGYYPLGLLSPCAGDSPFILPEIRLPDIKNHGPTACSSPGYPARVTIPPNELLPSAMPSMFWYLLCAFLVALNLTHAIVLHSASYWSPFTRDLAIRQNDQPRRRAVYIHIGASMLVSMALVLTVPWFTFGWGARWYRPAFVAACLTLVSAVAALAATLAKTAGYRSPQPDAGPEDQTRFYPWFNRMAAAAVVVVLVSMLWLCLQDPASWGTSYVGLFFSYRCLHPVSGVSPLVPVLLLLFAWYLWAVFQTARLRFSAMNRPRLPGEAPSASSYPLYVTDQSLDACKPPLSCCLFENIDCLLITRVLLARFFTRWSGRTLNWSLGLAYLVAFFLCAAGLHIQSMERFLHPGVFLTAYEWLIAILFYPLVMIALAGWLRVLLIWAAIQGGLLEPLERAPFRLAFSRLSEVDWVTMLGQSGLNVRWRDMARSTESLRQLMNNDEIKEAAGFGWDSLKDAYDGLTAQIKYLLQYIGGVDLTSLPPESTGRDHDLPHEETRRELCFIYAIEQRYAIFCQRLLEHVLIPYWNEKRIGFVNEVDLDTLVARHVTDAPQDPLHIRLAEEFLAIRYVALIRTVLVNIRHLMIFVSAAFVLAIVAWNSYPFQPHQVVDWCFTVLMLCLTVGFIWVFAQMHRNPILSRITATTPNELGAAFYIRLITFGAVPVLTWLAYQFPEIGGSVFRFLQPSLQVAK